MDCKEMTSQILALMERRTALSPLATSASVDPRLAEIVRFSWDTMFSAFDEKQMQAASEIVQILLSARDFNDFINLVEAVRTIENDGLFLYVLHTTVLHREDCKGIVLPAIEETAPQWFFAAKTIHEAIQLSIHRPDEDHLVINAKTAANTEPESKLAYFREDVAFNTHHWSWHAVYPHTWDSAATGIAKDRKGEIFYYMHQQMLARYAADRISNGMPRVVPLENFGDTLGGYSPYLTSATTAAHLGSRPDGLVMRDSPDQRLQDMELWRSRIYDAIDHKVVRHQNGSDISLDNEKGIDILGSIVESSRDSINPAFYGELHNFGHRLLASVHDPDGKFREEKGVMYYNTTSARDPIFYRWHAFIDNLFRRHKTTLRPYTDDELLLPGIRVVSATIKADETNVLKTFTKENYTDISHAPFFQTKKQIWVKYERLENKPFFYEIFVENSSGANKDVTIRVFLSPKHGEFGEVLELDRQRWMMMEMDKFYRRLAPGNNVILRHSNESSVTVSLRSPSFRQLKSGNYAPPVDYCTCGWPQHLLLPRGTPSGMDCVLFVMCTDYEADVRGTGVTRNACNDAISYCGAKDQKYPDTKPMGFPFDRRINASRIEDFVRSNMVITDVSIKYLAAIPKDIPISM